MCIHVYDVDINTYHITHRFWTEKSIVATAFVPKVTNNETRAYWEAEGKTFIPTYTYTKRNASNALIPETYQPFYWVVQYIEPYSENKAALGYNLYSNTARASTINLMERIGITTVTPRLTLVQDSTQYGVIIFEPWFILPNGDCTNEITSQTGGAFDIVFKLNTFLETSLSELKLQDMDIYLFDKTGSGGSDTNQFLARYSGAELYCPIPPKLTMAEAAAITLPSVMNQFSDVTVTYDIELKSRVWLLVVKSRDGYITKRTSNAPLIIFVLSLIASSVGVVFYFLVRALKKRLNIT
jgi:hypothetical protein